MVHLSKPHVTFNIRTIIYVKQRKKGRKLKMLRLKAVGSATFKQRETYLTSNRFLSRLRRSLHIFSKESKLYALCILKPLSPYPNFS